MSKKSRKKIHNSNNDDWIQNNIYKFMLSAAEEFYEEPDIVSMIESRGGYNLKIVADEENREKYLLFGCNDNGYPYTKRPFFSGSADEIIAYLRDKSNADDVLFHICYAKQK